MLSRTTGPAALVALATGAILTMASLPHGHQAQQAAPTPMQLFSKMLPVIHHDRCTNCHGGVDPISGENHEGGMIDTDTTHKGGEHCHKCHNTVAGHKVQDLEHFWQLPRQSHFFPGKSDKELCGLFSDFAAKQGHEFFLTEHLGKDELVIAGFEGLKAGAAGPNTAPDPPPDHQDKFIQYAREWIELGHGACDVEGTITLIETVKSFDSTSPAPRLVSMIKQEGKRTVTITFSNGRYNAQITTDGTIWEDHVQHLSNQKGPCDVTMRQATTYTGSTSGPATVTTKDTVFFADTEPSKGQTDYRIDVTLPAEHTQSARKTEIIDGCGMIAVPATPAETKPFDWPEYSFTLEGHLDDTKQMNLVGACDREVKASQVGETFAPGDMECNRYKNMGNEHQPWLMKQMWMEKFDGSDIPVRTTSYWNIRFKK